MSDKTKNLIFVLVLLVINIVADEVFEIWSLWTLIKLPFYALLYGWGALGLLWEFFKGGVQTFGIWFFVFLFIMWKLRHIIIAKLPWYLGGGIARWALGRRADKKMGELRQKLVGRFRKLIRNEIFVKMDKFRARNNIYKKAWTKRRIPPDYLPTILRENIIILYSTSNYLLRLYVWYVKFDQVKNAEHICKTMWSFIGPLYTNPRILEKEIYTCRNGGVVRTPTGTINVGWFEATKRYCDILNNISDLITQYVKDVISGKKGAEAYIGKMQNMREQLATALADVKRSRQHLVERGMAYGNHQPIKIQKYLILDQCNPYGWHEHQYKFIKAGTRLLIRKGARFNIPSGTRLPNGTTTRRDLSFAPMDLVVQAPKDLEVNHYGDVLEDIYANMNKFYNTDDSKKVPRRVHPDEILGGKIEDLDPPEEIMEQIIKDWDGFIKNMRFGEFRPNSKSALDYIRYLSTNPDDPQRLGRYDFLQEDNIKFTPGFKSNTNPAFDRRLLFANTGILRYLGRKGYRDNYMDIKNNPKTDPYPAVSSLGMSMYLPVLTARDTEDIAELNEFLKIFVRDTGVEVQSSKEAHKAMDALHTEKSEH